MCGIFGLVAKPESDLDLTGIAEKMGRCLKHRGPDDDAIAFFRHGFIGMTRLAITDPKGSPQPFRDSSGRSVAVFNGEIYNHTQIRSSADLRSVSPLAAGDGAVLLPLFAAHGSAGFSALNGMYAVAILDQVDRALTVIRDPAGQKPLLYVRTGSAWIFASELRTLLEVVDHVPSLRSDVWADYLLSGFISEPYTPFDGMHKLEPGGVMQVDLDTLVERRLPPIDWVSNTAGPIGRVPDLGARDKLSYLLDQGVARHLIGDAHIGVALSGGLDSSFVAAKASRHCDLTAFSVGYGYDGYSDEQSSARAFAKSLGIDFRPVVVSTGQVASGFADLCKTLDEPIGDYAASSYRALFQAAEGSGVRVMLTGQGADELLWGYDWVQALAVALGCFPKRTDVLRALSRGPQATSLRQGVARILKLNLYYRGLGAKRRLFQGASEVPPAGVPVMAYQPGAGSLLRDIRRLIATSLDAPLDGGGGRVSDGTNSEGLLRSLMETYLLSNGLTQIDRLSMSSSVEARSPFLDADVVRTSLLAERFHATPTRFGKRQLRMAAEGAVPHDIIWRRKAGFTPPIREWCVAIAEEHRHAFQSPAIMDLLPMHKSTVTYLGQPIGENGLVRPLWYRLATLEMWLRSVL